MDWNSALSQKRAGVASPHEAFHDLALLEEGDAGLTEEILRNHPEWDDTKRQVGEKAAQASGASD